MRTDEKIQTYHVLFPNNVKKVSAVDPLHNVIAVYAYFAMEPFYALELLPYLLVVHLAELAGIAVLLKVTL